MPKLETKGGLKAKGGKASIKKLADPTKAHKPNK
jgi:hypothetical protein